MDIRNVTEEREWFDVLLTGRRSQAAVMRLDPGGASGASPSTHAGSDQVLLVLEGFVEVHVGGDVKLMRHGDVVLIPAGTPHRVLNIGEVEAVTFNVYGPPAYPETDRTEAPETPAPH